MKKVLVIDDEESFRLLVHAYLRKHGYITYGAKNGGDGIRLALEQPPDVVLTDVKMTELDGFDVLKELKAHPETADIPVILMSGFPQESFLRSLDEGADDYLAKPFEPAALIAAVRARLKRQWMMQEEAKLARVLSPESSEASSESA